jgi:hypothetical protein
MRCEQVRNTDAERILYGVVPIVPLDVLEESRKERRELGTELSRVPQQLSLVLPEGRQRI